MAKRQRDYRAEYAARKARSQARGFRSPRNETTTRKSVGAQRTQTLTAAEASRLQRYRSEARRVSGSFLNSNGAMAFREDKANNPAYLEKYHRYVQMRDGADMTAAQRKQTLMDVLAEQFDMDVEDYEEFYDDDGGSVPE